jgi:hypothetical protein
MGETRIYSWHEHGQTGAANKPDTPLPVRSKFDFVLALSVGSVAFGMVFLVFILVYLLHGMSVEMLAIWVCCGAVAYALTILGGGLFFLTTGVPRDCPGKRIAE